MKLNNSKYDKYCRSSKLSTPGRQIKVIGESEHFIRRARVPIRSIADQAAAILLIGNVRTPRDMAAIVVDESHSAVSNTHKFRTVPRRGVGAANAHSAMMECLELS